MPDHPFQHLRPDDVVLDALPEDVVASLQVRAAWMKRLPPAPGGLEFVVSDLQRWTPGQTVRVAFLEGSTALHAEIADATTQITDACNLTLDFGFDPAAGTYRTWSTSDKTHRAEIRVSFDQNGYFSLVGTDSIDVNIGNPAGPVGGRPHQRSLNLGAFQIDNKPPNWRGVVRHEFMHAIGFHHEHQNLRGPCEAEFRWEDDPGYEPTTGANGDYDADRAGRRPGIYTYLAGFPNFWTKQRVDFNLRATENSAPATAVAGAFDRASIMLYRFAPPYYKSDSSPCLPTGDGIDLSPQDIRGLQLLYPGFGDDFDEIVSHRRALLDAVTGTAAGGSEGLEHASPVLSPFAKQVARMLAESLEHV